MKSPFAGFPPATLKFLRGLKKNNNREWFDANKPVFLEQVKAPMEELVTHLSSALTRVAPEYAADPKKALYRIYRDTRFSADKTPYKTHVAALFPRQGLGKNESGALYFQISPEGVMVAGGVYMAMPEQLLAIRTLLAERHAEFRKLAGAKALAAAMGELQGDKLHRPPKGFAADHPAVDLLRHKQWYFGKELDAKLAETPQVFEEVLSRFQKMIPVVEFLNQALLGLARKSQRTRMDDAY